MTFKYCENCKGSFGHKRNIGIGTLIAIFLTMGAWAILIPLYPLRCIRCGKSWSAW